jgi:hypothetical protein
MFQVPGLLRFRTVNWLSLRLEALWFVVRKMTKAADKQTSTPAERALAEAEARRHEIDDRTKKAAREMRGRGGLEPGRYGDWEVKGLTSDF